MKLRPLPTSHLHRPMPTDKGVSDIKVASGQRWREGKCGERTEVASRLCHHSDKFPLSRMCAKRDTGEILYKNEYKNKRKNLFCPLNQEKYVNWDKKCCPLSGKARGPFN